MLENNKKQPMKMEEIQKVSFEILKKIARICEKNQFRYCLMYGTLIGAIRHKGYIPWDDDVDIMMPRPDYNNLLRYLESNKDELGHYEVFNRKTKKDYLYGITRICDSRYIIIKENEKNCGMGIFIDIYPYDGLGNNKDEALCMLKESRILCDTIVSMIHNNSIMPKNLSIREKLSYLYHLYRKKISGLNYYYSKLEHLCMKESYDDSLYVGPIMWYFTQPEKVLFERSFFDNFTKKPFEKCDFYVPTEYDKLLKQEYGDYMQLPPVDKRVYHHQYKAYKKQ